MRRVSKSQLFVINAFRPFLILLALLAMFLTPSEAWEASVSQNLTVTVTPATQSVSFNPAALTFPSQGIDTPSGAQTITMTNTGNVSFPLSSVAITGTNGGDFSETNNCPKPLAVSATCQISVTFTPTATGTRTASVAVSATGGGTYTVALSGTGVSAFFVATNGSDSNPGTLAAPFATLGKCQSAMQTNSTVKTCYIRAGTYNLPHPLTCNVSGNSSASLNFTSADNNEVWSYYPPDGYNNAIIDFGGQAGTSNGAATAICINGTNNLTFTGLQLQNAYADIIYIGSGSSSVNITNNILHGQYYSSFPADNAIILVNDGAGSVISHNYIYSSYDRGVDIEEISTNGTNNISVDHNVLIDTCHNNGDCGAIYYFGTPSAPPVISANYVKDINLGRNQPGIGENVGFCIYYDSTANAVTASNNVCTGSVGYANPAGGGGNACFFIHSGNNNMYTGNICDLQNPTMQIVNSQGGSGNSFTKEIIISNQAQTAGAGYACFSSSQITPSTNDYYNYNTSYGINSGGCNSDPSPQNIRPLIHCWGAIVASNSAVFNSPVYFPTQPSGWDTPGFWGPPGFTIPHVGTAPSWSTSSGDGVTCTATN
jgi:hypothetical protein